MIVVDASALVNMLVHTGERGREAHEALRRDLEWAAPEHWKSEVFSVIRRLTIRKEIDESAALDAVVQLPHLGIDHVSLNGLLARMWRMRDNISGYDAAYVALAQVRGCTLVTADGRLAKAATAHCRVELV